MTRIQKISLTQFKNYSSASFSFSERITCIVGANGTGKTNLLDAIYYLCYTKSYFSFLAQASVQHGTDGFRIEGTFIDNNEFETVICCKWRGGKKEIWANECLYEKLTDHIGKYAAVMIAPDDIELINEGSEIRRKWIDSILGQVDKLYLESILTYQRVLQQRNAWLKLHHQNPPSKSVELEYYDAQLARFGTYIYLQRQEFLKEFLLLLERFYAQLCEEKEAVLMTYHSDLHQKAALAILQDNLYHDFRFQRTLRGIHKDELTFLIKGQEAKLYASQGQKKSLLFALKLAQHAYLRARFGFAPILLLDDIFEKLDQQRMNSLLDIIVDSNFGQVFMTDTHEQRIREAFGGLSGVHFILM
ncbi:MAG: DNA replication/repair protein RecF [Bacteroidetes bacterium]|nr:DNA replication/repair protein RecF [Bacteroidota bacterium]